jgi:hypothetical protein
MWMSVIRVQYFHALGDFTSCLWTNIYDKITFLGRADDLP